MKKQIILMVLGFLPVFLLAQNTPLSSLYEQYASKAGFVSTEIFPGTMSFEWEKAMNLNTFKDMMKEIQCIRILRYKEDGNKREQAKFWKKIQKTAGDGQYKEVVAVSSEKVKADIYLIREPSGNTKEVAFAAKSEDGIMMITISGNLDFSMLFSKENMQHLRDIAHYFMENKGKCIQAKD